MKISKVIKVHPLVTANACTKCYLTPRLLRCFSRNQHGGPTDHHPSSCSTCKAINNRHGRQRILFSLNYVRWKHKQLISTSLHQHISYLLSPVPHEKRHSDSLYLIPKKYGEHFLTWRNNTPWPILIQFWKARSIFHVDVPFVFFLWHAQSWLIDHNSAVGNTIQMLLILRRFKRVCWKRVCQLDRNKAAGILY